MGRSYKAFLLIIFVLSGLVLSTVKAQEKYKKWGVYRGTNMRSKATLEDLKDLSNYGANIVRVTFNDNPFVNKTAPYDFNEGAFIKLDSLLDAAEKLGMKVIVDVHTTPGTEWTTTTFPQDAFWKDHSFEKYLVDLWKSMANKYKNRGDVIAAYDLLNEPSLSPATPTDNKVNYYNNLIAKLVKVIRSEGDYHTIMIEPPTGYKEGNPARYDRISGVALLNLPEDNNIVISPHMYIPSKFTHAGLNQHKFLGYTYPGEIDGVMWNKQKLEDTLMVLVNFQKAHAEVPIFIGEFSATNKAGESGNRYINDLIEIYEKYNWSWAYHSFRSATVWDPEINGPDLKSPRTKDATRINILRKFFEKNKE